MFFSGIKNGNHCRIVNHCKALCTLCLRVTEVPIYGMIKVSGFEIDVYW